ncbi:ISxac3 transposase [Roseobacter sp. MED193]|nr:ISxac3 transposase [Roseobacter sp. MED193]
MALGDFPRWGRSPVTAVSKSLGDFGNDAGANGAAAFADRKAQTVFHRDRGDQFNVELQVVAWHNHLGALGQSNGAGDICGPEVELWTVVREERRVTATFILGQDIGFSFELGVRLNRLRCAQNLATLNSFTVDAAQQGADVVASFTAIQQLAEHFNTGTGGGLSVFDANDFNAVTNIDHATLNTASHNGTTTRDREHVFNRHQEGLVNRTRRRGDILVNRCHQLFDFLFADFRGGAFHRRQSGTCDDWNIVARVLIGGQQLTDFHFNQLEQLFVVDLVNFVHEDNHVRDANLATQQDVLTSLRHRAVSRVHNQDGAIHLRRTGDHVFHIVSVAGAVDVRVVAGLGFILNVSSRDGDAARFFFWCAVDLVVGFEVTKVFGDRCGQSGFTVVNVADGADVDVRLITFKLFLSHDGLLCD